jgi:hypothetical protein
MVKREKVTAESGREWVDGRLDADTYFAQVEQTARAQARQTITARLASLTRLDSLLRFARGARTHTPA